VNWSKSSLDSESLSLIRADLYEAMAPVMGGCNSLWVTILGQGTDVLSKRSQEMCRTFLAKESFLNKVLDPGARILLFQKSPKKNQ